MVSVNDPSLTSWAAETFSLLPPFGVTEDVNDECGELTSVETGKLLTALKRRVPHKLLDIRETWTNTVMQCSKRIYHEGDRCSPGHSRQFTACVTAVVKHHVLWKNTVSQS